MTLASRGLPPLRPIPIKDRSSILFLEKGRLDVLDGAFVLVDKAGVRVHIPVGGVVCSMLEPGTRVSHAAVALAARAGTLLIWVGEAGVRLYAAGQPGGARADRLLYQARLALDDEARLRVVRKMYALRFQEDAPARRSVDQLRGIEGARVREMYKALAGTACHGADGTTTHIIGTRPTRSTAACPPPRRHCTGSLRRPCSPPAMRRRLAFCILESPRALSTTLRIFTNSRPSSRWRSASRQRCRLSGPLMVAA